MIRMAGGQCEGDSMCERYTCAVGFFDKLPVNLTCIALYEPM